MKKILTIIAATAVIIAAAAFAPLHTETDVYDSFGAMVRHNTDRSVIYLIFSADSMFEGAPSALDAMHSRGVKANFFFTGNFLERPENQTIVRRVVNEGHYVGGHSNHHILLADWGQGRPPLVTTDSMLDDARQNILALEKYAGVCADSCRWFLPPFEWIGPGQVKPLQDSLGFKVINPTPEIETYRDYTTPDMREYASSDSLIRQLFDHERRNSLNGNFMIIHLGTQDVRTDKLYSHLPMILDSLSALGYTFERLH